MVIYCQLQSSLAFYLLACLHQGDKQSKILFWYHSRPVGTRIHCQQSSEYFLKMILRNYNVCGHVYPRKLFL